MKKPRASTSAVPRDVRHGGPIAHAKAPAIPAKWLPYQRKLRELRDTLLAQNRNLLREAQEPVGTAGSHVAESGTDEFERGMHFSLLATEQNALHEIEAALERIESGTFGICESSGKRIPAARLKAIPWTRYTASVKTERERQGAKTPEGNGSNPRSVAVPRGPGTAKHSRASRNGATG
jgi:RNA polymerase-binding transcription factor DksA